MDPQRDIKSDSSQMDIPSLKASITTVRILFVVASSINWTIFQLDVNNELLLVGDLEEKVYMSCHHVSMTQVRERSVIGVKMV